MNGMNLQKYILAFLLATSAAAFAHSPASAQACKASPAICPTNGWENWGTPDDSVSHLDNPVLPQEVAMENRLRQFTTQIMARIASKEGWEMTQVEDGGGTGYRAADGSVLAYDLRPPHWYTFTYQFIINQDSMAAWRSWLEDFGQRRMNTVNENASQQLSVQDKVQACMDSANYYGDLKGKYMTAHFETYQKALMAGNKTVTANYEKDVAQYDKKINTFTDKAGTLQKNPGSEEKEKNYDAEGKTLNQKYWDGCILIVQIAFNHELAGTVGSASSGIGSPAGTNSGLNGGFTLAKWYANSEPDNFSIDLFPRSKNLLLLLMGPWNTKADSYGGFRPAFHEDKIANDRSSIKKIKSDQVQTIDFHISGNGKAMHRWLSDMPVADFNKLMVRF
jgi:hypothetical protein